jgi:hypothetical protein
VPTRKGGATWDQEHSHKLAVRHKAWLIVEPGGKWIANVLAVMIVVEWYKPPLKPTKSMPRLFLYAKRATSTCGHACETACK